MFKLYDENPFRPSEAKEKEFAKKAGVTLDEAKKFLRKQPVYQIYMPPPAYVPRPTSTFSEFLSMNDIHQADLLYLPKDGRYKYALTLVDVATRFKVAVPLRTKTAKEAKRAFDKIYKEGPLREPKELHVDKGGEFKSLKFENVISTKNKTFVSVVERFNGTLARAIFVHQYMKEIESGKRFNRWVERLPSVLKEINDTYTSLIKMKPSEAIKLKTPIKQYQSLPKPKGYVSPSPLEVGDVVRYLYQNGEAEGDKTRKRATDPNWSITSYQIISKISGGGFDYYYLGGVKGRHFLREELLQV